ncbi:MAG: thioredoxin family protein [Bacteroidales bacterium]|jgi:thiol:disulfide interchange protein DsbD|nr:thioredoxin family protein [Bacteroidales bacterium]
MKKIVPVIFLAMLFCPVYGQVFDPVKWEATVERQTASEADIRLTAIIEPGWAMYSANLPDVAVRPVPTSFTFTAGTGFELSGGIVEVTPPKIKYDANFDIEVGQFSKLAVFRQRVGILTGEPFSVEGSVEYMCCNDNTCLSPRQVDFSVRITPVRENAAAVPSVAKIQAVQASEPDRPEDDAASAAAIPAAPSLMEAPVVDAPDTEKEAPASLWGFFLMALSAGFLGVLTPCVYPMIPLTVSFFLNSGKKRMAHVAKAVVFGLSIILIYTSVGVIVALTKSADITNQIVGHWLTNLVFAAIFIAFALSFFGLYEITLPGSPANRIHRKAGKGDYLSAFFIALTLVTVSFSCTGPFVGSILVASAQGLAVKPVLGMFGFGLAFASPFAALAFFPAMMKKLPKSGGWMNSIKIVFAFVMTAFALYFLSCADHALEWNIITRGVFLSIWIVLFTLTGLYLLGKIRFVHDGELPYLGVGRLLTAVASFSFALYLFTGLWGEPLHALSGLLPAGKDAPRQSVTFTESGNLCGVPKYGDHANLALPHGLQGYFDYDEAIACAKEQNKPVLMIFKGHGCAKCREMEANVWADPEVRHLMATRFVLLALYTDDHSPLPESEYVVSALDGKVKKTLGQKNADLQITRYQTNTFPYHVILTPDGETAGNPLGYTKSAAEFKDFLTKTRQ